MNPTVPATATIPAPIVPATATIPAPIVPATIVPATATIPATTTTKPTAATTTTTGNRERILREGREGRIREHHIRVKSLSTWGSMGTD
eukprot:scaffold91664_cov38-Attheya_sp.AAC.1